MAREFRTGKWSRVGFLLTAVALSLLVGGCGSGDVGAAGATGADGSNALVATTSEAAGANCASGGQKIASGLDGNGNGVLDPAEVTQVNYVCNGSTGANGATGATGTDGLTSLVATTSEPAGANCAYGGQKIASGLDSDGNGVLDPAEVTQVNYVCNGSTGATGATGADGLTSLVTTTSEPAGANCASGGQKIESGLDSNSNGVLDPVEVSQVNYVCNGATGSSGATGADGLSSLVNTTTEPAGANCASGGQRIASGLDSDGNGVLDPAEVSQVNYVCNGSTGATGTTGADGLTSLVATTSEPVGANCAYGGQKIASGLDSDGNGVLDSAEVTQVNYVCNGATGPAGPVGPVIENMAVDGNPVAPGSALTALVDASSAEGLVLTYAWTVPSGWAVTAGAGTDTVFISAPPTYGASGTVTVTVTDNNGTSVSGRLFVSTEGDTAPTIETMSISPQPVLTWANLSCSAYDPNGDPLSYTWTIGGIDSIATGNSALWASPGIPGEFNVSVAVSDGLTTVTGTSAVSVRSAAPWPRFHRGLQGTGLSSVDTSTTTGTLRWSYPTGAWITTSPVIGADGTVYVGSRDGNFYALNSEGSFKWSSTVGIWITSSPAIGSDGTVYVGSYDNSLLALNPTGTLKWSYPMGGTVYSSPAIGADGTIYVGSLHNGLYAISPDGSKKWSYPMGGAVNNAPAIGADGTIYVGTGDHYLYALNPDGSLKWRYATGDWVGTSPAIGVDGTIYIGSNDGYLYALNPDGSLKWRYSIGNVVYSSPAIGADGTIYFGSEDYSLYALNPDGTLKWSYATGNAVQSSPAVGADGTIYFGSNDGSLYALNPDGSLRWLYTIGFGHSVNTSPAIGADGTIYVGSLDGSLYAIH